MTQQTAPFLEGKYGWSLGESNWNLGMDENLLKFSYMFDKNIDGIVSSLPPVVNGTAYFNTTDKRIYFAVDGTYYSTPTPKWFILVTRTTGEMYQYDGTSLIPYSFVKSVAGKTGVVSLVPGDVGLGNVNNTSDINKPVSTAQAAYADSAVSTLVSNLSNTADFTKGAALIPTTGRVVPTIAALRLLPKTGSPTVIVTAEGVGGIFTYDPADTTSADNNITIYVTTDGGRFKRKWFGAVNVMWAGAACDGVTNDTAAVQTAVNFCSTFTNWPSLEVPGKCRLNSSVNIDRLVDTTTSEFRIFGTGAGAGFHTTNNIDMFTSTIAVTVDPKSEFITFENINFTCDNIATGPRVLSNKFLRMKFINCYFYKIKCMSSSIYTQSIYFIGCNIRYWPGVFCLADYVFDINFIGCISEFGNGSLTNFVNGIYSGKFVSGVHEGSAGGLIAAGKISSLVVRDYYLEGNATANLDFSASTANKSILVEGCFFSATAGNVANTNFYDIIWSNTAGAVSIANNHDNGRLHDNSSLPAGTSAARMFSQGDTASIAVFKSPLSVNSTTGTFTLTSTLGSGTSNYAKYRRHGDTVFVEFSFTFAGTSGSNAILQGLPYSATSTIFGGSVTYTDATGTLYLIGGSGSPIIATATSFAISSTQQGTGVTYTTLAGKTIVGRLEYSV